jgi:hypothetical protein
VRGALQPQLLRELGRAVSIASASPRVMFACSVVVAAL